MCWNAYCVCIHGFEYASNIICRCYRCAVFVHMSLRILYLFTCSVAYTMVVYIRHYTLSFAEFFAQYSSARVPVIITGVDITTKYVYAVSVFLCSISRHLLPMLPVCVCVYIYVCVCMGMSHRLVNRPSLLTHFHLFRWHRHVCLLVSALLDVIVYFGFFCSGFLVLDDL